MQNNRFDVLHLLCFSTQLTGTTCLVYQTSLSFAFNVVFIILVASWSFYGETIGDSTKVFGDGEKGLENKTRLSICLWTIEIHSSRLDRMLKYLSEKRQRVILCYFVLFINDEFVFSLLTGTRNSERFYNSYLRNSCTTRFGKGENNCFCLSQYLTWSFPISLMLVFCSVMNLRCFDWLFLVGR